MSTQRNEAPKRLLDYLKLAGDHLRAKGVENDRLDAELDLAAVHLAQLVTVVQLYKTLGGGWDPMIVHP